MSEVLSVTDFLSELGPPLELHREISDVYPTAAEAPGIKSTAQEQMLDIVRKHQIVTMATLASQLGGEGYKELESNDIPLLAAALVLEEYVGASMLIYPVKSTTIHNLSKSLPHDALASRPPKSIEETEQETISGLHVIAAQANSHDPEIAMIDGCMAHVKGPATIHIARIESRYGDSHEAPLSIGLTHNIGVRGEMTQKRSGAVPTILPRLILGTATTGLRAVTGYRNVSPLVKQASLGVVEQVNEEKPIQPIGLYSLIFAIESGMFTSRKFRGKSIRVAETIRSDRNMKTLLDAALAAGLKLQ